jgi:hypothetical protein
MSFTSLKAMVFGILLLLAGITMIVGYALIPGFLWGASLGGIWAILSPFGLLLLGAALILVSLADSKKKRAGRNQKNKMEKTE